MRKINENMHAWTLDEVIDQEIGKAGTPERDAFETKVEAKIRESEEKASMHIVVPVSVRDAIRRNAAALGESANAYINSIFEQVVTPAALEFLIPDLNVQDAAFFCECCSRNDHCSKKCQAEQADSTFLHSSCLPEINCVFCSGVFFALRCVTTKSFS